MEQKAPSCVGNFPYFCELCIFQIVGSPCGAKLARFERGGFLVMAAKYVGLWHKDTILAFVEIPL